jgi:dolichol-phosphate mannosyltransferase
VSNLQNIAIVIPSLNPDEKLIEVVEEVLYKGFKTVIVVNDGSSSEYDGYFERISKYKECTVLKHYKNLGKGRALKTAFNYFLNTYTEHIGLITADADNQHHVDDIVSCAKALVANSLSSNNNNLILGCRDFDLENVPKNSKLGNKITRFVFKILCGIKISDTQTGLRALPAELVKEFLDIEGERYEYETNMLIEAKEKKYDFQEIKIQTIYIEDNKSSHFNPIKDSIKIYLLIFKHLFKFGIIGALSTLMDLGLFTLLMYWFRNLSPKEKIFLSTLFARIFSSLFNYFSNSQIVFNNTLNKKVTMTKYYILAVIQMSVSYLAVLSLSKLMVFINPTMIKILVDFTLFILSFQIQREWVFKKL